MSQPATPANVATPVFGARRAGRCNTHLIVFERPIDPIDRFEKAD